ncbi:MAG: MmgE/PrpD family protein [Chloroflexi bacterium]|nr:MmgE/PrpD family protein [Chloroflexota bacterium]
MDATKALVTFCHETRFEDVPGDVVDKAKRCVLDALGCGLGGSKTELAPMAYGVAQELGGAPECTIIGAPFKTNCVEAAWVNAQLISVLDYDDTGPEGHPGSTIVASALVAAERAGASGRDFLAAVILGYEACCRVGLALRPSWERLTELQGMSWQSLGGAVAAGRLLGLSLEQLLNAYGVAGATSSLPAAASREPRPLSWVKDNVSWQAAVALHAVLLARRGYIGNTKILDRFWIKAGSDRWNPERLTQGLGETYTIQNTGFKLFPCCYILHSPLRALVELVEKEKITAEKVKSVVVRWPFYLPQRFLVHRPERFIDYEFSIPFATAMVLLKRHPATWISEANMREPAVLEVMDRVTAERDNELEELYRKETDRRDSRHPVPGAVTIQTTDGRVLKHVAMAPWGAAGARDGWEVLGEKFQGLAEPTLGPEKTERLLRAVRQLEGVPDMSEVTALL